MLVKKAILSVLIVLFSCSGVFAAPDITGVSGTIIQGSTITVTGTDMVSADSGAWSVSAGSFEGANYSADGWLLAAGDGAYDTNVKLLGNKSFRSDMSGNGATSGCPGTNSGGDYIYRYAQGYNRIYVRYSSEYSSVWTYPYIGYTKLIEYVGPPNWYIQPNVPGPPQSMRTINNSGTDAYYTLPEPWTTDRWYCVEWYMTTSACTIWVDGKLIGTRTTSMSPSVPMAIGAINACAVPSGTYKSYIDGAMSSTSRIYPASTIEISNNATYHAGTYKYQPPVSLSDTSVQFKADLAGLGDGPLYLWITNEDQVHNVTPYNLSGSPIEDTTAPETTASPTAGEYLSSQTITLTCADNVACDTTYYCWGSSCTPTTEYSTPITISADTLRFYSVDTSSNAEDVSSEVYTITASDTDPPAMSDGFPYGILSYGATTTTMTLTTDEAATCKYDTSDTTYSLMSNTFSTTGGTSHSQALSGLTNGGSYEYYCRCTDGSNENDTSYQISFSVSDEAPTTELLFEEHFEDTNYESRGWYDNSTPATVVSGGQTGNCMQWAWTAGQTKPTGGDASRKEFTPTDEVYISFYIKFDTGWRGSQETYHPHMIHLLSDVDGSYQSLNASYLNTYIEFISDIGSPYEIRPQLQFQDVYRVNTGLGSVPNDLSGTTENRSTFYCNQTPPGSPDLVECYSLGGGYYYSAAAWDAATIDVSKNEWHHIEVYYRMNTISGSVGQSDGIMREWIDSVLVVEKTNMLYRTNQHPDMKWAQFVFAPYIGDGAPISETMWVDELSVYSGVKVSTPALVNISGSNFSIH